MGASSGAGSPIHFVCPVERREHAEHHACVRTGSTRPYRTKRGAVLGVRSTTLSHEFWCLTCGYAGWSNHIGVIRLPLYEGGGDDQAP